MTTRRKGVRRDTLHLTALAGRLLVAAALGGLGLACATQPATAVAAAAAADEDVIATASYGKAEIWLRRKPDDRHRRELVFRSTPGATPRVLRVTVPPRDRKSTSDWSENLALGLDRRRKLTVVMQSRHGLYWTHVAGKPRLRRVPRTNRNHVYPSIFRGRIAAGQIAGSRSRVRLGSLTHGLAHTVWRNRSDRNLAARDTAIGAGDAVAFVAVADGAEEALFDARLVRPGRGGIIDVWPADRHNGGVSLKVSGNGRRLTVAAHRSPTVVRYALPSGRRLTR